MGNAIVPFTNKHDQGTAKDLGGVSVPWRARRCFSVFVAIFTTCRKNNVSATEALFLLFQGQLPDFISLDGAE